ncbi:uncharacterized protein LOC113558852 [Rhopalosiphum maidis]|uniref:uncharacterized protein LOC113558852 n=1 Tax=Rhopalosiphum maidis TaxID=43146 RepID=UPI000F00753C|nr:uncharacterized protein LOC113558852 [Rhopalosiphum maidis]XP_026820223.1 uncharacterized protein LOC113558852 [Rhopalosiphum maidis]
MAKTIDDLEVLIKLPPLLLKAFSININQAKCMKCNLSCASVDDDILFHLSVCNGILIDENIQPVFKFHCLKCYFITDSIDQWKCHLFKLGHISINFDSDIKKYYSHDCNSCKTHFYGSKISILQHQCRPKFISLLSEVMAYVYAENTVKDKQTMLHYCTDCFCYTYDLTITDIHIKKHSEAAYKYVCNSCMITFYGSKKEEFLNHKHSFEHIVLWFLNGARTVPKLSNTAIQKLPYYITKYFIISSLLEQFCCIVCNKKNILTYECIYDHFHKCISSKEISCINSCIPLLAANCNACGYLCSAEDENVYECWLDHVISFDHLSKTVVGKKNKQKLFSYYCYVSDTVFYGTDSFIKDLIFKTNDDVGRLLFISDLMAKVYKRVTNAHFSCNILFCCGICQNYTDKQLFGCVHQNNDLTQSLYCSACLVKFNVHSDYNEHLVTSEHIILKYFKSNQLGELKILDRSMETMKIYLTNLTNSDDDDCNDDGDNDKNGSSDDVHDNDNYNNDSDNDNSHETKDEDNNEMITSVQNLKTYDLEENIISNLIAKLSVQPNKSAFNNYLRMNFELINQMPQATNVFVESVSFICDICNLVIGNRDDWIKHDGEFHIKDNDFSILYCDICRVYNVNTSSINIDHHLVTNEHIIMKEFHEYLKKNLIKPSINNINNCNNNSNHIDKDNGSNVEIEKIQNPKVHKINKTIHIEFKDVNTDLKKNNYCLLNKIIQEKYGKFKQIKNVDNSFIILFKNINQVKCLVEDKKKLIEQYGFSIHVIGEHKEKVLSLKTIDLFEDWGLLCDIIFSDLEVMNRTLTSSKIQSCVQKLCDSIYSLQIGADSNKVHIFGSRVYGLATNATDIDLYLETDDTFDGEISNDFDIQVELVKTFTERCLLKPKVFQNVEEICNARVPIVKFYHIPSKLNCDVSFKSGLSVYNTKLIKLYLSLSTTVKWLVCVIVKHWALQNGLKDRHLFTSYALIWLVLFYLMTEKVVPSVMELRQKASKDDHKVIEGWDCTFGKWSGNISDDKRAKLLLGFFQFYANKRRLKDNVLSTCTGRCMKKHKFYEHFTQLSGISKIQRTKFKTFQSKVDSSFEKCYGLVLQDPFELSFNLTKNIYKQVLTDFCELCNQSSTLLINMKGYNMFFNA